MKKNMGRWWRAYENGLDDPKLQSLPPRLFKFWFNLMCIASRHEGLIPPLALLKHSLKCRLDVVKHHLNALQQAQLIDSIEGQLVPHNWHERQYKSDLSTERVKRYRNVARNVSETSPDTESETDTERAPNGATPSVTPPSATTSSSLHSDTPRRRRKAAGTPIPPDFTLTPETINWATLKGLRGDRLAHELEKFKARSEATGKLQVDWQKTFKSQMLGQYGPLANGPIKDSNVIHLTTKAVIL